MTMQASKRHIRFGGLMRCCLETVQHSNAPTMIGDRLQCPLCGAWMLVDPDGTWTWERVRG